MVISWGCSGLASCHWVCQKVSGSPSTALAPLPSSPEVSSLSTLMTFSVSFSWATPGWLQVAAPIVSTATQARYRREDTVQIEADFVFIPESILEGSHLSNKLFTP